MSKKDVTVLVATYDAQPAAEADFEALEALGKENKHQLHDAALIAKGEDGEPAVISRQTRHGWGKGALIGAVVGLFVPYVGAVYGAGLGAGAGAGISGLTRGLGRDKVDNLSQTLDKGKIALIAVVDTDAVDTFKRTLTEATEVNSESAGLTSDDIAAAIPGATPDAAPAAAG